MKLFIYAVVCIFCNFTFAIARTIKSQLPLTFSDNVYSQYSSKIPKCCSTESEIFITNKTSENLSFKYQCGSKRKNVLILQSNIPNCDNLLVLHNRIDKWFEWTSEGEVKVGLHFWFWPAWLEVRDKDSACWDVVNFQGENEQKEQSQILFTCHLERFEAYLIHRKLYGGLYMISSAFVFLTLLLYLILWKEHNTHGVAQFSFFTALALFYVTEGSRFVIRENGLNIQPSYVCFIHAVLSQLFFMTVNTTSGILGFDLLWTLWSLDPSAYKIKHWKRLYLYILIGWGTPLVLMTSGLTLNHYFSADAAKNEKGIFEYAHYRCSSPLWQSGFYAQLLLYSFNVLFFVLISILICKHRRKDTPFNRETNQLLRNMVSIYSRLFLIMGMTWIAVIIEFFLGQRNPLSFLWLIFRVINLLLGVLFFILFGLNRKHIRCLRNKYHWFNKFVTKMGCSKIRRNTETLTKHSGRNQESECPT